MVCLLPEKSKGHRGLCSHNQSLGFGTTLLSHQTWVTHVCFLEPAVAMEKQPARVWSHCAGTFPKELQEGNLSPKKKSVRRRTAGNQEPESGSEQGWRALHRCGGEGR